MTFLAPEWFFFIPLLIVIGWKFRMLRLYEPLRLLLLVLLVVALAKPTLKLGNGEMDLWLMVDQSDSTLQKPLVASEEILGILERSKRSGDQVRLVDFAKDAIVREKGDPVFRGGSNSTRIGRAIDYILAQADSEKSNRLLILSDGYPTDTLDTATEKLISSGIVADSRIFPHTFDTDYRIAEVRSPSRIRPGEAFLIEFTILSNDLRNTTIPWEVQRGQAPPLKGTATLDKGKARVRITDRLAASGATAYDLRIIPETADPIPQNNFAHIWVEVTGGSRTLLVTPYPNDPIAPFLKAQGIDVSIATDPKALLPEHLTGARLVILNNVLASELPANFLESINFFVNDQGGGLLMCGGRNSFGSGGYFASSIDALLPVSMELRNEHRKLRTTMSIILDRSGSMSVSTSDGRTKMDLANAGTANAIELLSDQDYVSVHAVDSSPHAIASMCNVGENRQQLLKAVRRIESMGGGIFVEEGIKAGWRQLRKTDAGTRHLILFSDANDSEQPGNYKQYLADMQKEGITVSVIALGSPGDSDAELLKEIAELGGGRLFFSDDGSDLPSIFAQETVSVARSAFLKDITPLSPTPGWTQIAAKAPAWPASVQAYNLSYLREGATTACISGDEYQAPLVAFWARGAGRTAAVSFPMGGEYSDALLAWDGYGDFTQTLCRWLMGNGTPEGFALKAKLQGERLELELLYSDDNIPTIAKHAPESAIEISSEGKPRTVQGVWEHIEPGKFRCSFLIDEGEYVRGALKVGQHTIPFGPIAMTTNPEWEMSPTQKEEFVKMISLSGGSERHDLTEIWNEPRAIKQREITPYLVWVIFALALADALLTRLGISLLPGRKKPKAA